MPWWKFFEWKTFKLKACYLDVPPASSKLEFYLKNYHPLIFFNSQKRIRARSIDPAVFWKIFVCKLRPFDAQANAESYRVTAQWYHCWNPACPILLGISENCTIKLTFWGRVVLNLEAFWVYLIDLLNLIEIPNLLTWLNSDSLVTVESNMTHDSSQYTLHSV